MKSSDIAIIGSGASGITAAITLARRGRMVTLLDRMPSVGRKIAASGNGRCNLLNDHLSGAHYNLEAKDLAGKVLSKFGRDDIVKFFESMGVRLLKEPDGRLFPYTNQSKTIVRALEIELARLRVDIMLNCAVTKITRSGESFIVKSGSVKDLVCGKIILACGGKSYPALGSDGSGYALASALGHSVIEPVPSAVPVVVKSRICHSLQGQRMRGTVSIAGRGSVSKGVAGDILFTDYGLSGTAILDISERISVLINRKGEKTVSISVDPLIDLREDQLSAIIEKRVNSGYGKDEILVGLLPNKVSFALKDLIGRDYSLSARRLKDLRFDVTGTRGWNEAEFTSGGVDTREVGDNLESRKTRGVFLCGEMLNVTGPRGGYNLAWAWSSGHVAGESA